MANRLAAESSPYLLQHAHNPVDWYPWGDEALKIAKAENKPILVSIGYSACHWCHVMERESFENEQTASFMNAHFVNIKIDREERPDLDHLFMDAVQAISGSGGWPLNVFLTPEGKPFYGGTYFPPVRAYNRSSWPELLSAINSAWLEKPHEILAQAENLTSHISQASDFEANSAPGFVAAPERMHSMALQLLKAADKDWGGFGNAPKFPQTMSIAWLMRQYYFNETTNQAGDLPYENHNLLEAAIKSLLKMMQGGIYDHLGGGFARYSTDTRWMVPHFEKMLYDNALLAGVIAEAYQLTKLDTFKWILQQTLAFVDREWISPEGGFYSAYDADSEGVEGKYYTWTWDELQSAAGHLPMLPELLKFYQVSEEGNWEHRNILWTMQSPDAFCRMNGLDPIAFQNHQSQFISVLLRHREKRTKPSLDDKQLLGWNALMITAYCKAYQALGEEAYLQTAEKAAAFIEQHMAGERGRYHHNYKAGKAANPAFLDDLAFYIEALTHLAEASGNMQYLWRAYHLAQQVIDDFSDENNVYFYFTPGWQQDLLVRQKEIYDGATPSGNSTMARNLHYLAIAFDQPSWNERALAMLDGLSSQVARYPTSFGNWGGVYQLYTYGSWEIVALGPDARECYAPIARTFLPNKVAHATLQCDERLPLFKGKTPEEKTWLYICQQYACKQPMAHADEWLKSIGNELLISKSKSIAKKINGAT